MSFMRRSRKGKIHTVRQRIAGQHKKLSRGLARANQSVIGGVNQVHRGLQLGIAKGHSAIQSGLKGVERITGDFSMPNYYQYQRPVAMFSMAEVEKYNKYGDGDYAYFETKALPGSGQSSAGSAKARWQRASTGARKVFKSAKQGAGRTFKQASYRMGQGAGSAGAAANRFVESAGRGVGGAAHGAYRALSANPRLSGALALGTLGAGAAAGGAMFLRRRRTKKGKVVVEQVRR